MKTYRNLLIKIKVSEVMKPPAASVAPSDLATRARGIMRSTGLHTLPVMEGGKLQGIVTLRRLLSVTSTRSNIPVSGLMLPPGLIATPDDNLVQLSRNIIALDVSLAPVVRSPIDRTLVGLARLEEILNRIAEGPAPELTVGDVMSRDVTTCGPKDKVSKVWTTMEETRLSGVPVTRHNRQKHRTEVIGMVTRSDIIKSGAVRLAQESSKGRSSPSIESLMHTPPITIPPHASLSRSIGLMVGHKIGRLPVVERGGLVGIIDREDVIKPFLR